MSENPNKKIKNKKSKSKKQKSKEDKSKEEKKSFLEKIHEKPPINPQPKEEEIQQETRTFQEEQSSDFNEFISDIEEPELKQIDEGSDSVDDLFGENQDEDYESNDELDHYDLNEVDDTEYPNLPIYQRHQIEMDLENKEEKPKSKKSKKSKSQSQSNSNSNSNSKSKSKSQSNSNSKSKSKSKLKLKLQKEIKKPNSILNLGFIQSTETELPSLDDLDFDAIDISLLRKWRTNPEIKREISKRFHNFLVGFSDENGKLTYVEKIKVAGSQNEESLVINYSDLSIKEPKLAMWVADSPMEILPIFDEAAYKVFLEMFESYEQIQPEVHVRISDFPLHDSLRDLRQHHLNTLIKVTGVVTRRTNVFPQLKKVKFVCPHCNSTIGPFVQNSLSEIKVSSCPVCSKKGPFRILEDETIYRNFQKISLQESPGTVSAGRLPRTKEVILLNDLIDSAKPGEEIEVTGVYRHSFQTSLNSQNGFPVFATVIEANFIVNKEDSFESFNLSHEDINEIKKLSKDPKIRERIISSIAPSIYGLKHMKTAIAMALFGGEPKLIGNKHRIRGDLNVLLLGDPSMSKSQILKYVEKTAHRAVFTSGKGASGVGLTYSVRRDSTTGEWTLEGGAFVLADQGFCLIDEFDKMNDHDRTSIHETMEQQSISVSKAGIVTTLRARCSVVAAANPIRGKYDPSLTFSQNVDLSDPILSRFDILCVVRDTVDPIYDEKLAKFVVESHVKSHPNSRAMEQYEKENANEAQFDEGGIELIPQSLLKKYILYAKKNIHPQLTNIDEDKIKKLYSDLRSESAVTGSIPITVRYIESLIRMAESVAKMHLRDYVREDDLNFAIKIMLESFISTQKFSVMKTLRNRMNKYLMYKQDSNELLFYLLQSLVKEKIDYLKLRHQIDAPEVVEVDQEEFEMKAKNMNLIHFSSFYSSSYFVANHFTLDKKNGIISKKF
ncbi:DNA helicase [Anaeramoeba ignava]|uniref:DNA replication licensing factor MCM2 n=1 Tax=Anaeramoeba ignava TaxID=1746090 RepID=A0A9Q0LI40_ANAIG|nr:DNA helicase [Anaeramoeba ignava]